MSDSLRDHLQFITDANPVETHPQLISALATDMPHSIVLKSDRAPELPISAYNCFEFAFGIAGRREIRLVSKYFHSTCCDGAFAEYLAHSVLNSSQSLESDGTVVLYRNDQQFTHAGLVSGNRVLSKWGTGLLWLHAPLEVPTNYGQVASYVQAIDGNVGVTKFLEYARNREGESIVNEVLELEQ